MGNSPATTTPPREVSSSATISSITIPGEIIPNKTWVYDPMDTAEYISLFENFIQSTDFPTQDQKRRVLDSLIRQCIMYSIVPVIEYFCILELALTEIWDRDMFRSLITSNFKYALACGKFDVVRVIASYCVPEIVELTPSQIRTYAFKEAGREGDENYAVAQSIIDKGMQDMKEMILGSRTALIESELVAQLSVPPELLSIILLFCFSRGNVARFRN